MSITKSQRAAALYFLEKLNESDDCNWVLSSTCTTGLCKGQYKCEGNDQTIRELVAELRSFADAFESMIDRPYHVDEPETTVC